MFKLFLLCFHLQKKDFLSERQLVSWARVFAIILTIFRLLATIAEITNIYLVIIPLSTTPAPTEILERFC